MKRYLKCIVMTLSLLLVLNVKGVLAQTLPSNVHLVGDDDGILISLPEGEDSFLYKDEMLPGDSVERTMTIENKYQQPYALYIRAERVGIEKVEKYDLLEKLQLKLTFKDKVIYEGPVSGKDGLIEDIELGTIQPGDEAKLHAVVTLDGPSTGHEYMNKEGAVDWIFTATSEAPYPEPDPEEPVEPDKKPNDAPKTGDNSVVSYAAVALGSLMLLVVVAKKNRKASKEA